jgi:iron(III) transport system substrate-binding protein
VALGYGPAVAKCAPHPHAAVLFNEFMLGEGQEIFAKRDMAVTNPKISSMPPGLEITLIDPADMLDNRSKWDELWASTVTKPR